MIISIRFLDIQFVRQAKSICFGEKKFSFWLSASLLFFIGAVLPSAFADSSKTIDKYFMHGNRFHHNKVDFKHKLKHHKPRLPTNSLTIGLSTPYLFGVNEKTNRIYVANYGGTYDIADGSMSVIDGETNRILEVVAAGDFPDSAGINEKTNKIYVTNNEGGTVTVIEGRNNSIVDTVVVGSGLSLPLHCGDHGTDEPCTSGSEPLLSEVNEKTNRIYVALWGDNATSVIDGETNREIAVVPTGINPYVLAVNEKTNKIYVTNVNDDHVSVIDGNSNTVINDIVIGENPFWIAVNEHTNKIYVSNPGTDEVYVVDGNTDSVESVIPVSGGPFGISVNEKSNTIYVAKLGEDSIVAINGKTNRVIGAPIPTGGGPFDIAVNEKTDQVYVLNLFDNTITVLGNEPLEIVGLNSQPPGPLRVPIENLGILQLAIHDLYSVNRNTEVDSEDFKLNLSTVLDYGQQNIANGGDFKNMENPMTFTVAKKFGQAYLALIDQGETPDTARSIVTAQYLDAIKRAYETTFFEQFPKAEPANVKDATLTGDLALRTLHDLIPGKIMVNGILTSLLDPALIGKTLSDEDMKQLSSPLDGQYDAEFRDMINPFNGEHIDLLERDSSFATQFNTNFTFEEFQSQLVDGKYDPSDDAMKFIRADFGFSQ